MKLKSKSIRFKLVRFTIAISATLLLLTFSLFLIYELYSYRETSVRQLSILANVIASNSTAAVAFKSQEEAHEILSALSAEKSITSACIYDENNRIFSCYPDTLIVDNLPKVVLNSHIDFSLHSINAFTPIQESNKKLGTLFIQRSTADIYERIYVYLAVATGVILLSFFLTYLISSRLQEKISSPIISLAGITKKVSTDHDYSIRAEKTSDDEIGILTDAFNDMLTQIQIQNSIIETARLHAQRHAEELEIKVNERTLEYRRQKEFAEIVIDSSLVLIAVFDTETRLLAFNSRCEEEFKMKREQVLGKKYEEAMPQVKGTLTLKSVHSALAGELVHNELYQSAVSGNYYESYVVPLKNEDGKVYAALMTAHNITALVEASQKLKEINAELNRKNSELEQFAYVASHDLQEPLRKIQTFTELLVRSQHTQEEFDRYTQKIKTSAARMSALIKDVLEYSRLSQLSESFTEIDLNTILENVMSDFELLIVQKNVTIKHGELPIITGNKLQIHQLFANLISNAIKFNEKQPIIEITCTYPAEEQLRWMTHLDPQKSYAEISFQDNGIGFDAKFADKVFTIFQRLATREKYEGTGIGLALCKKIVENHQGNISVISKPGIGTTFTILLPVMKEGGSR